MFPAQTAAWMIVLCGTVGGITSCPVLFIVTREVGSLTIANDFVNPIASSGKTAKLTCATEPVCAVYRPLADGMLFTRMSEISEGGVSSRIPY